MDVWLLWHAHELPEDEEDVKLIGVYASPEGAERARARVGSQPGFRSSPEGFEVSRMTVGKDEWTEGFVTEAHDDIVRQFGSGSTN